VDRGRPSRDATAAPKGGRLRRPPIGATTLPPRARSHGISDTNKLRSSEPTSWSDFLSGEPRAGLYLTS
jgi:hypothetical protein